MNNPFPHVGGPFAGIPGPAGFGFGPHERRALHEQRRQARREFRDYVKGHDAGHDGPFGPGFGRGFGRGFGPGGFGPG
ncbi:MAG: PadR family transcriptional regulator, partial [Mycobacterium sp.]